MSQGLNEIQLWALAQQNTLTNTLFMTTANAFETILNKHSEKDYNLDF